MKEAISAAADKSNNRNSKGNAIAWCGDNSKEINYTVWYKWQKAASEKICLIKL
jgi:hypothetical protein